MLDLNDDILVFILNIYTRNYIRCKKYTQRISKLYICSRLKILYNKYIRSTFQCNLYYISDIRYSICSFHNKIKLEDVKKIVNQIIRVENRTSPNIYHNNNSYDSLEIVSMNDNLSFIHCDNLIKNEQIIRLLLNKFGYKMLNYCCNGTGCRIKKIKENNINNDINNNINNSINNNTINTYNYDTNNIYNYDTINLINDYIID